MKAWTMAGLVAMAAMAIGCGDEPLRGSWENEETPSSAKDEMTISEEGGTRDVEFDYPLWCGDVMIEPRVTIDMELTWKGDAESGYELEFECTAARIPGEGGCEPISGCDEVYELLGVSFDVEIECDINKGEDELDCEYDGESFTFERTGG